MQSVPLHPHISPGSGVANVDLMSCHTSMADKDLKLNLQSECAVIKSCLVVHILKRKFFFFKDFFFKRENAEL